MSCSCSRCIGRRAFGAIGLYGAALISLAALIATGCASRPPAPPPVPPALAWTLSVRVVDEVTAAPIVGAMVSVHTDNPDDRQRATTNAHGLHDWSLWQAGYTVCAFAVGYDAERCVAAPLDQDSAYIIKLRPLPAPPPIPLLSRLTPSGRWVLQHGARFRWRFATGFRLLDYLADGNPAAADRFIAWAQRTGFNGVRVLATAEHLFQLRAEDGRTVLPALLAKLRAARLYVELVALADTRDWPAAALAAQVDAVGRACAPEPGCLVQVANEHYHSTQHGSLHEAATLRTLAARLPAAILTTESPASNDEAATPAGEYVTRHRSRSRDEWNNVRRVRELHAVSEMTQRFVVDDEPIGADERDSAGRRESNPSIFFAQGVLCRLFEVGCTFHFEDGLQARVPRPVQQLCAERFIEGTRIVPDAQHLTYKNAGWHDAPIKSFNEARAVRAYAGVSGNSGILIVLGLTGDPGLVWQNGWRVAKELRRYPGVVVYSIAR